MNEGWIKIHRKMIEWEWFTDVNVAHLFLYLILSANHDANSWRGILIERGQTLTSLDAISVATGLSVRQTRTALDKLEVDKEITQQVTNKYRIITISKYNDYQIQYDVQRQVDDKQTDKQMTSHLTNDLTNDLTTNKKIRREEDINITHTSRVREEGDGSSIVVLPIDSLYREHRETLAGETEISNSFIIYYKNNFNYDITCKELAEYLDSFHAWLLQQGSDMKSMRDYRRHFSSWLQIQIKEKLKYQKNGTTKRPHQNRLDVEDTTAGNECNF